MFRLKNSIQKYDWGKIDWLADFLGLENRAKSPLAELWMGSHPKASSQTEKGDFLFDLINDKGNELLGKKTFGQFGQLPFLFKVLAIQSPLSIQVHPTIEQACLGFERENKESIPLDAFNRNYKDNNHKPEIICAVEPFTAMKGFRSLEEIERNFTPLLDESYTLFEGSGHLDFFFSLISLKKEEKKILLERASDLHHTGVIWEWVRKLQGFYPGDITALSPLFLNLVCLEKGEALFLPAGEMHAYLGGVGIELMANSDNVLRGGLTPKHMDLEELKKIVTFESSPVKILDKGLNDLYPSFVGEFSLGEKLISENYSPELFGEAAIILVMRGIFELKRGEESLSLKQGDIIFVDSHMEDPSLSGEGEIFWATTGRG